MFLKFAILCTKLYRSTSPKLGVLLRSFAGSIFIYFSLLGAVATSAEINQEQWRSDIDYLAQQAPKVHPNLFHAMTPAEWQAGLDAARDTAVHTREDEIIAVMQLVTLIQD